MTFENHERAQALREQYRAAAEQQPKARIRTLAAHLGVSELELVAAQAGDVKATALRTPPQDIFRELGSLGRVMALTRNEHCVHERHGRYEDIRAGKSMGIVLGPDIDLRVFFSDWAHAWAVESGGRKSLQFFDRAGMAVHKVYLTPESDAAAWDVLVEQFTDSRPEWPVPQPLQKVEADTVEQAPPTLREEWLAMQDTHEFFQLLKRNRVERLTALRDVGADLAQQVPVDTAERMLNDVAAADIAFMCFVGNHGMIQIHSGPVKQVRRTGPWFNVLEPHFNLHLDTQAIDRAWVVNKPTVDGWVTSLECFSRDGEMIVQFFGARKPGQPELPQWRALLESYCPTPLAA